MIEYGVGIKCGGTTVSVRKLPKHKMPALCVEFDDEDCIYKVATFDSKEKAEWFIEVMEEFYGQ